MSRIDTGIWKRFLLAHLVSVVAADYDVKVGKGRELPEDTDPVLAEMWDTLIHKRIDVVLELPKEVWVVEVKQTTSMSALGQALTYATLYRQEVNVRKPVVPMVIADSLDIDMPAVFLRAGVGYVVLGSPSDQLPEPVARLTGRAITL